MKNPAVNVQIPVGRHDRYVIRRNPHVFRDEVNRHRSETWKHFVQLGRHDGDVVHDDDCYAQSQGEGVAAN